MTMLAPTQASPPVAASVELDLTARLALVDATMTGRLRLASLAFDVNTAHIPAAPAPEITAPLPLTPTTAPTPCPYGTPIAGTLHRARNRIMQDGWCREIFDDDGAVCPIRAIRLEATTRGQADDACVLLLDVIQAAFPDAETIPSWNAEQTSAAPVLLTFGHAVDLAHSRNL